MYSIQPWYRTIPLRWISTTHGTPPIQQKHQLDTDTLQGSLIPMTLIEMSQSQTNPPPANITAQQLRSSGTTRLTLKQRKQVRRSLNNIDIPSFYDYLRQNNVAQQLQRHRIDILQLNIGLYCNQACVHCHVESSPKRVNEQMTLDVAQQCIKLLLDSDTIHTVDLTGGAPDLCQSFRYLVTEIRKYRPHMTIINRCNLTSLLEPDQTDLAQFLADNRVTVIASLPCYSARNVDEQRGNHVFQRSIRALQILNKLGYGDDTNNSNLQLTLVYNPNGAFLPPLQSQLEQQYKHELYEQFNIKFNNLLTITNMPIRRFADYLYKHNQLDSYMKLLVNNFNPHTVSNVMCTNTISIDWQGYIYDCDFNQQLGMNISDIYNQPLTDRDTSHVPIQHSTTNNPSTRKSVYDISSYNELLNQPIATDSHCFGCTAGAGSSCQGATVQT